MLFFSWNTDLRCKLISTIDENPLYKRILYPPPGGNPSTAKGGGTPKTDIHWSLVKDVLGPTEKYGTLVKAITSSSADAGRRSKWGNKVKTCLSTCVLIHIRVSCATQMDLVASMQSLVLKFDQSLSATGSGMTEEDRLYGYENKQGM
jgi:hypothetical protein